MCVCEDVPFEILNNNSLLELTREKKVYEKRRSVLPANPIRNAIMTVMPFIAALPKPAQEGDEIILKGRIKSGAQT